MNAHILQRLGKALIPTLAFFLNGCTAGSLPTQGQLPPLDGSALTNVNASKVGTLNSAQVVDGITALTAATNSATASTLVKRDGQGNFSAGVITAGGIKFPDGSVQLTSMPANQIAYAENNLVQSTTLAISPNDSIPQISQGVQILSATITPLRATDHLLIRAEIPYSESSSVSVIAALFQDPGPGALTATISSPSVGGDYFEYLSLVHQMPAGTTSAITFTVRVGLASAGQTMRLNGDSGGRRLGGVLKSTLTVQEIGP